MVFVLGSCGAPPSSARHPQPTRPSERLPDGVRPLAYALELTVAPERPTFFGLVRIEVELAEPTDAVWLHARDLDVRSAWVVASDRRRRRARWLPPEGDDFAGVALPQRMGPGSVTLELAYRGRMVSSPPGEGFYRARVDDAYYAITQFEPTGARRALPCFDEPRFRAPFRLTLTIRRDHVAAANAPIERREDLPTGWIRLRHHETEPLPTYLLGWAVGPFDVVSGGRVPPGAVPREPVPLRAFAPRGHAVSPWLLAEARAALIATERFLGTPYPFDKLDFVMAPRLPVGGMENAGMITVRWRRRRSQFADDRDRIVVTHEIGHQWLGDLVTIDRWEDQWLKESLTEWLTDRVLSANAHAPRHGIEDFLAAARRESIGGPAVTTSAASTDPSLREILGSGHRQRITRGVALLSTFERWIGTDTMAQGIGDALRDHAWGTARLDDYLVAIAARAGRPELLDAFRSFVDQPGLPVIQVALRCEGEEAAVTVRQAPYRHLGTPEIEARWTLPICFRHPAADDVGETCVLLRGAESSVPLDADACPAWVIPNAGGQGWYWVEVDDGTLDPLLGDGWDHATHRERRFQLASLFRAVDAGHIGVDELLARLSARLSTHTPLLTQHAVWLLSFVRDVVLTPSERNALDESAAALLLPIHRSTGWQAEGAAAAATRYLALHARHPEVRAAGARLGRGYLDGELHLPPYYDPNSLEQVAMAVAVQESDEATFERWLLQAMNTSDRTRRRSLLVALARSDAPERAQRAMTALLESSRSRYGVALALFGRLRVAEERDAAWRWALSSLERLDIEGRDGRAVAWALSNACSASAANELARAAEAASLGGDRLRSVVHEIRVCAAVAEWQAPRARGYLEAAAADR